MVPHQAARTPESRPGGDRRRGNTAGVGCEPTLPAQRMRRCVARAPAAHLFQAHATSIEERDGTSTKPGLGKTAPSLAGPPPATFHRSKGAQNTLRPESVRRSAHLSDCWLISAPNCDRQGVVRRNACAPGRAAASRSVACAFTHRCAKAPQSVAAATLRSRAASAVVRCFHVACRGAGVGQAHPAVSPAHQRARRRDAPSERTLRHWW